MSIPIDLYEKLERKFGNFKFVDKEMGWVEIIQN